MAVKDFCRIKKNPLDRFSSSSLLTTVREGIIRGSLCSRYHPFREQTGIGTGRYARLLFDPCLGFLWEQCWGDSRSGLCSAHQGSRSCPAGLYQVKIMAGMLYIDGRYVMYCSLPLALLRRHWWKPCLLVPLLATVEYMQMSILRCLVWVDLTFCLLLNVKEPNRFCTGARTDHSVMLLRKER